MFKAFVTLFSEADILFYFLLILTIALFVMEVFLPSQGLLGVGGVLMATGTITERCVTVENTANEMFFYIFYIILFIALSIFIARIVFISIKSKPKQKYTIVDGNKIPLTKEGNLDYSFLLGLEGEVISDLKPTGKVRFEKGIFEVTSTKEYIYAGSWVRADRIANQKIIVKKL